MNDKAEKPSFLTQLLSTVGTLVVVLLAPVGILYTFGNIIVTIIVTLVLLLAIIFIAKYLKDNKEKQRRYKNLKPEYILLGVYGVIAIALIPFMFHFFYIDFLQKDAFRKSGIDKLNTIKDLKTEYNKTLHNKKDMLETQTKTYLTNYLASKGSDKAWADSLESILGKGTLSFQDYEQNRSQESENELKAQVQKNLPNALSRFESKYSLSSKIDKESAQYYKENKQVFLDWDYLQVSYIYGDIDNMYNKVKKEMQQKMPAFKHNKTKINTLNFNNPFSSLANATFGAIILFILGALLCHYLILSEYINTKRKATLIKAKPQSIKKSKF